MKVRRLLIVAMWLNLLAVTATAEMIVIRPDPCPIPANAPKIFMFKDAEARDLNPHRMDVDDVVIFYEIGDRGWASARILARFELEGDPHSRSLRCR